MPKHPDFEQIYQNFISQYGEEQGTNYYYAWLNKNELDDTKPYNVEEQYFRESLRESFHWIKPQTVTELNRADPEAKYWKLRALTANMSMNLNDYRDIQKMMSAARSLSWRPLNMNHDHNQWLPFPDARVHFATFEDNAVECIIRIPNYLDEVQRKLDSGEIVHPSIEGFPLEGYGATSLEGFNPEEYTFTALALLEKGIQLPGDPLTTIDPLTESVQHWMTPINESLGHSLVESLKRRKKMKEQTTVEPTEFSDEERAKRHYELSDEQWNILTPEEQQDLISKLPRKAEETPPATAGVVEQTETDEHGCVKGKEHWDGEACVANEVAEQLSPELEVTAAPEEQSVDADSLPPEIPVCDPGTHWNPEQMKCVPDEVPTGETAGADATTPGPEQTMPLTTEAIIKVVEGMVEQEDNEYWGGRGPGYDNCIAYFTTDEGWSEDRAKEACADIGRQTGKIPEMLLRGQAEEEHGCAEDEVYSKEQGKCIPRIQEQTEPEKDEHGCVVGKEKWDGEACVAIEPETTEKLKEQDEPVELQVQGEEIPTEPSKIPPAECEVGTHWDDSKGECVPDEPTSPEDALDVTVPEEETTLERYLKEKIALQRKHAKVLDENRELKQNAFVLNQEKSRLERKLAEARGQVAELEREQLSLMKKNADLQDDNRELEGKKGGLHSRLATRQREVNKLQEQIRDLTHQFEKCTSKRDDLNERNTHNLKELNQISNKLLQANQTLAKFQKDRTSMQKEIATLSEESARLTKDNADLSEKYAESAKKTYGYEKENVKLHSQVNELTDKLNKTKKFGKIIVKV